MELKMNCSHKCLLGRHASREATNPAKSLIKFHQSIRMFHDKFPSH